MATNNSCDYSPTQYNVQVGGASGTLSNIAPSSTSGVALISQGASSNPAFGTVVVAGGGTGLTSATAYAVLCGGTTSTGAFQSIAGVGTSGQVLTSNGAGALPTFQNAGGNLATNCSFAAYRASSQTITNTTATVQFANTFFNNGSNYNTGTYTFTAPATGLYMITTSVDAQAGSTGDSITINIGSTYGLDRYVTVAASYNTFTWSGLVSLSSGNTVYITYTTTGTATIAGATAYQTSFTGYRVL